jgi:hypothetical protein
MYVVKAQERSIDRSSIDLALECCSRENEKAKCETIPKKHQRSKNGAVSAEAKSVRTWVTSIAWCVAISMDTPASAGMIKTSVLISWNRPLIGSAVIIMSL